MAIEIPTIRRLATLISNVVTLQSNMLTMQSNLVVLQSAAVSTAGSNVTFSAISAGVFNAVVAQVTLISNFAAT